MNWLEMLALSSVFTGSLWTVWYWQMQPVALQALASDNELRRHLQREPASVRQRILAQGRMTRSQWAELVARQQQAAARALRRR